jgi:restriction system protein
MLGKKSIHAAEGFLGGFIGADFEIYQNLIDELPEDWRHFNKKFIPVFLSNHPDKTKISAGLACGALWMVSKGIKTGDIVLCPDGGGSYRVGEIKGDYYYVPDEILPHRRPVHWLNTVISRSDMSEPLRNSTGSIGTVSTISQYASEIEKFISGTPSLISTDETVEDPSAFAMEKHLEDFLVMNWSQTELGKSYDIYEEDGEKVGQ